MGEVQEHLVSFESGHYKKVVGEWQGDSVWCHIKKPDGTVVHINKDKVEYIQVRPIQEKQEKMPCPQKVYHSANSLV